MDTRNFSKNEKKTSMENPWDFITSSYMVAMYQGHTIPMEHPTGSRLLTKDDL